MRAAATIHQRPERRARKVPPVREHLRLHDFELGRLNSEVAQLKGSVGTMQVDLATVKVEIAKLNRNLDGFVDRLSTQLLEVQNAILEKLSQVKCCGGPG